MLFNSLEFLIFLPTIFCLYWFVFQKNLKVQNSLLLISSYVFYGWWDYRFLSLIILSTIVDYFVGLKIHDSNNKKTKKAYLWVSIFFNLGLLGFFKYFNFFIDSWVDLLSTFGYEYTSTWTLNVILPMGISFYTFQTMSYSLDIYYGKLKPTKDFISFSVFVSFFPQLVAGPIERASNLLPQILSNRYFKYEKGVQGLRLILWGMFKKVVIADSLASNVDTIFNNYTYHNGGVLFLGLIYFTIQIYSDFSGYSDIAIGTSLLFGFELMSNFNFPLFSRNPVEFWKKWHISLTSWIRDYIYWPMAVKAVRKKSSYFKQYFNNIYIWIISGFWHGANFKFILWGFYWGVVLFIYALMQDKIFDKKIVIKNSLADLLKNLISQISSIIFMFLITGISFVIFRSENIANAFEYLYRMIINIGLPTSNRIGVAFVLILVFFDWIMRKDERVLFKFKNRNIRYLVYVYLSYMIFAHFQIIDLSQFIYFVF